MKLVSIEKKPNILIDNKLQLFLNPDYIYLPMYSDKILVNQDAFVYKNEIIIDGKKKVSSSISGKVLGINKYLIDKRIEKCVVIENDFRERTGTIKKIKKDITVESILKTLEKTDEELFNIFKSLTACENIVISAIHDEPYVINNIISLKENINDILEFIDKLSILYKSNNNKLVVKNIESEIIDECLNVIGTYPNINLTIVNDEYLLGKKEFLLKKINLDLNKTLYLNIKDMMKLINLVKYNKISSTKIITISGNAIEKGKVIKVKRYTLLKDVLQKFIKITDDDFVIIANSLLNGFEVDENLIITDNINSIHIMKKQNVLEEKCIKCGKCVAICPVGVDPVKCLKNKKSSSKCINCGLCSYICPSYIPLSKYVKGGK